MMPLDIEEHALHKFYIRLGDRRKRIDDLSADLRRAENDLEEAFHEDCPDDVTEVVFRIHAELFAYLAYNSEMEALTHAHFLKLRAYLECTLPEESR